MSNWIYPTAFPTWRHGDGGPESDAIDRVLRSGRYTMGPEVEAFEAELAIYHGRRHAICCNSGSSANLLALSAISRHIKPTKRISLPAVAWATTYAPFAQLGFGKQIIISDVDNTWNAVHNRRGAHVVLCPVLGNPAPLIYGDVILEDGCESAGARSSDDHLCGGSGPIISTGSGFWSHQISCIEMGWLLTDDAALAQSVQIMRNHGNIGWGAENWEERYNFTGFGYNLRPLEMHAAIGREQLKKLDEGNEQRRRNLATFLILAADLPIYPQHMQGANYTPFGIAFEVEDETRRVSLAAAFAAAGIDSRPPTGGSFTMHPYGAPWRAANPTPRADRIHRCGMFLGNPPWNISPLIEKAVRVMLEVL